ncbi:MAG: hypothetical protein H6613_09025 [Ignavibacteriales bacterium]|nr:hypothetical protein [Ignavibacteriales bacterium]
MNYNRNFISTIEDFYRIKFKFKKRIDEQGNIIIITVAEWKDEISLKKAKEIVKDEYERINFNPAEMMTRLNVKMDRGTFGEIINY